MENFYFKYILNIIVSSVYCFLFLDCYCIQQYLNKLTVNTCSTNFELLLLYRKISIVFDCWTSPDQKLFIDITDYFISMDFQYHEILLDFLPLEEAYSGKYFVFKIIEILKQYNLQHCLLDITTDNINISLYRLIYSNIFLDKQ